MFIYYSQVAILHIRPYPLEYTGSRPLSPSQTSEGRTSTQVGDHWGILGVCVWSVVCDFSVALTPQPYEA
ncbi:uncharacterized protein PgNI_03009 [Pyricularia grisea]|uniref:Uncharacterized protein n=1 Tax=Pyricularia grisea TaxID=148305 RepID=A0A6P8BCJ5_PYRGI|nr:uncharacterized protein PgNI_03009 [Pyricularia grisea]TLD13422.1 hypothetical protein PgNI_03009 [Pyricularia grisea]